MKLAIVICNLINLIAGILSIPFAITSVMIFDAPGAADNNYVWITFWSALFLPLICFISAGLSLLFFKKYEKYKIALSIAIIPYIDIAIICLSMAYIQIYCNGNFSCH